MIALAPHQVLGHEINALNNKMPWPHHGIIGDANGEDAIFWDHLADFSEREAS